MSNILSAALGAGASVLGAGVNAILGWREAARQRRLLNEREAQTQAWYNRRYNEVGTERADAKAALTRMREAQQARTANAVGRSAVMGATTAQHANEQQAANNAIGNTVATINAQQAQQRDAIDAQNERNKQAITDARNRMSVATSTNLANAVTGLSNAAAHIVGGMYGDTDTTDKNAKTTTTTI